MLDMIGPATFPHATKSGRKTIAGDLQKRTRKAHMHRVARSASTEPGGWAMLRGPLSGKAKGKKRG